jgi:hypothetical protein
MSKPRATCLAVFDRGSIVSNMRCHSPHQACIIPVTRLHYREYSYQVCQYTLCACQHKNLNSSSSSPQHSNHGRGATQDHKLVFLDSQPGKQQLHQREPINRGWCSAEAEAESSTHMHVCAGLLLCLS